MPNRKRDSEGRFASGSFIDALKDRPYATAAAAAGVAAAGAFLWARRDQIGEIASSGMDKFSELKAQRMGSGRTQEQISEEALTLKETGKKSRGPRGPLAQQDIKAGMASG
jgi:hypothetical protein